MPKYLKASHHDRVPRGLAANLRFRRHVLRKCRNDVRFRKAVLAACRDDILFWINVFVWQFNPNAIGEGSVANGPFISWPRQEELVREVIDCIEGRADLVVEKSREMGASWLALIVMTWLFIFHPLSVFLCVSRNAESVDSAKADSLFWKIDYVLKHLPEWMTPQVSRRVMSFVNEDNGSQINGQATTAKAGVGGRATAMFIDEFAVIDEGWELLEYTANTTGCRIFNSTHRGTNTAFFELVKRAQEGHVVRKFVLHWSHHPDKVRGAYRWDAEGQRVAYLEPDYRYPPDFAPVTDGSPTGGPYPGLRSPWYDDICERMGTARGVASDLDINPSGSQEQVFDPLMILTLKRRYCQEPAEFDLEYDKLTGEPVKFWPQKGGEFKLWQPLPDGTPSLDHYVACADIATGTGATPSCLSVANARTGEKILEYTNSKIEPKEFAYLAVAVARLFADADKRPAKLGWEVPGPGNTFGKHGIALGLRNVYYRRTDHRLKKEVSDTPGWSNSPESMKQLIENYKDALRANQFLNRSTFALSECLAFVYAEDGYVYHTGWKDPKDPSGARINHGDRVVADALCWKLMDEWGKLSGETTSPVAAAAAPQTNPHTLAWRMKLDKIRQNQSSNWA
jgi:hypothetical protein